MAVNGTNFKQYNNMSNNIWICLMIFELSSHFTQSPIVHKLKNIWSVCENAWWPIVLFFLLLTEKI